MNAHAEKSMLIIKFSSNEKKDENFVTEHVFCLTIFKLKNVKTKICLKSMIKKFAKNLNEILMTHH